jgi:hypothetical protein
MRKRWVISAVLLGLVASSFVWFRLSGPLWRHPVHQGGRIAGFSADRLALYLVDGISFGLPEAAIPPTPRLACFDAETGGLVSAVNLDFPEKMADKILIS